MFLDQGSFTPEHLVFFAASPTLTSRYKSFHAMGNPGRHNLSHESHTMPLIKDSSMKRRPITLIEVLQPRPIQATPERARVTRTVVQPEIDSFELMEAQGSAGQKSARTGRRTAGMVPQFSGA